MNAQPLLPKPPAAYPRELKAPSRRNRAIFRAVKVDRRTQSDVAKQFKLTRQRVSDIVEQVTNWLVYTGGHDELCDWLERLCVTEFVHRERLDKLFASCWRN